MTWVMQSCECQTRSQGRNKEPRGLWHQPRQAEIRSEAEELQADWGSQGSRIQNHERMRAPRPLFRTWGRHGDEPQHTQSRQIGRQAGKRGCGVSSQGGDWNQS